jgi:hypothetical protein
VFPVVTGNMAVSDFLRWQLPQKLHGLVAMIHAIDVNIIDVEQQQAIGSLQYIEQKIDLWHLLAWGAVIGHVLDGHLLS